jgi:hypothetical protein
MRHLNMTLKLFVPALAAAMILAACSKEEPQPEPRPEPSKPEATESPDMPKPVEKPSASVSVPNPPPPPPPPVPPQTAEPVQGAAEIERSYVSNPDFSARVQFIYQLSDLATPEAVSALGRLFQMEKDPDLRTEVLDSLYDIDGLDDQKAAILAAGASAYQPKEVRESAIDALTDIDPKKALPILQALVTDPDPDIRDDAKDAIEQVQETMNNP